MTAVNFVNTAGVSTAGTSMTVNSDGQITVTTPVTGLTTKTSVNIVLVSTAGNGILYNAFSVS